MSGLIFSEASGFADSLFGKSAYPIHMVLEKSLEAFEQSSAVDKIFSKRKSKYFAEKVTALSAMDNWSPSGENSAPATSGMAEVFDKVIEHVVWTNSFAITREMVDDSNFDLMRIRATKMMQAWGRTREEFAMAMLAGGTGKTIKYAGRVFDTTAADKMPLFSKTHPNFFNSKKTQSNLFSDAFSNKVLAHAETAMQNFVGDKNEILGIVPDTIMIPNDAELKYAVFEAIGADKDPATSNNGFNYNYGRWTVIINPYWVLPVGSTDKPYIMMDTSFNKNDGTALWFERVPVEVSAYEDKYNGTKAAIYDGYARFGVGFNNWRGMIMGGVTGGTSLIASNGTSGGEGGSENSSD